MAEAHIVDEDFPVETAGQALRRAREGAGLGLDAIAEHTKIPERHLQAIEADDYGALPAGAYAVGFSRTYARAVGLDEREIARMVRSELDEAAADSSPRPANFEPGDPARIPSSAFAWVAAILALAVIAAGFLFWQSYYSPAAELPPIVADASQVPASPVVPAAPAPAAGQEVVFTALVPGVWVKFYDAAGQQLLQKELAEGESYKVPTDANGPLLWTARPDALAITVGGRPVAKLAERQQTIKDVPVDAASLLARRPPPVPPATAESVVAPAVRRTAAASPAPRPRPAPEPSAAPAPLAAEQPAANESGEASTESE